jgi:hypothetical protein
MRSNDELKPTRCIVSLAVTAREDLQYRMQQVDRLAVVNIETVQRLSSRKDEDASLSATTIAETVAARTHV